MLLNCEVRVLKKTLESPLDSKEIQPVSPKGINPEYSLKRLTLKLKLQYFGHLIGRVDSQEKTLMLEKIEGKRRRGRWRMRWLDGITDTGHEFQKTRGDSERWKPDMLQSMGLYSVRTQLSNRTTNLLGFCLLT